MSSNLVSGVTKSGTAYETAGPSGAPCMVLIHGLGLCRRLWDLHVPRLSEDFQVVTYDLFGHGESSPSPEVASLTVFSEQLVELLDHLGQDKATLVGFSIGGMINRRFAMDHPERLESLMILNSPHDRGEEAQSQVEDRAAKVREQGSLATMDDALKRWFTPSYLVAGNGAGLVKQWRQNVDAESYAQAAWVLANGVRELIRPSTSIDAPTLVMTCENDTGSTPAMAKEIASEIKGSELKIVPELQHLGLMENPDAFTLPVLEFMTRNYQ